MELKFDTGALYRSIKAPVLIVPLWNWNVGGSTGKYDHWCVLIVPLWNWNRSAWNPSGNRGSRSNRTFMELKWWTHNCDNLLFHVLIVPLWNWNMADVLSRMFSFFCSNRTFMELKSKTRNKTETTMTVLIVPLWNWNRWSARPHREADWF